MKRRLMTACGGTALLSALCSVLLPAPAGSAIVPDTPAAYTWSLPVTVSDDNGVHAMRMPSAVYLHAQSAALADIRLFDKRGLPVPYALRQPPTDTYTDARELPLRLFPLYRQEGAPFAVPAQGDFKLELRTDSDGRLLSVTSAPPASHAPAKAATPTLESLILDLGIPSRATPPAVTALRFSPPAGKPGYAAQVWLEASDDLRNWRALGTADLQWLSATDGAVLACDLLAFEPTPFRYARLTWRSGTPALFAGVTALSFNQRQLAPSMDHAVLAPAAGRVQGDLVYAAGVGIPAERAGMQFNTPNAVYAAMLGRYREAPPPLQQPAAQPSRRRHHLGEHHLRDHLHRHRHREAAYQAAPPEPASSDPFIPIASATFYDITQDGKRKRSGGLPLGTTQLAQWVVRPYSPQAAAMPLSQAPRLQLSWTPATLLFLANRNGPYTLAFGRAGAPGMEHELGHIAPGYSEKELRALPQAEAGTARPTSPAIAAFGAAGPAPAAHGAPGIGASAGAPGAATAGAATGAATGTGGKAGAARATSASASSPSGRGLLWAVLLVGVAGLAYLTVRLLKQPSA